MGAVYLAEHTLIGRRAAVKVLLDKHAEDPLMAARFLDEARVASLVRHPGLVDVFDYGLHERGNPYIVMELLDGESLARRFSRERRMPARTVLALARQIASALAAAHACGIVHRDLKPDNVFLVYDAAAPEGVRAKVLDFGICKLLWGRARSPTRPDSVVGTPLYMAPEQCRGAADVDHRADIYSLGCLMHEMLSGAPPFDGAHAMAVMNAHVYDAVPSLARAGVAAPLAKLVERMLAKHASDRPRSLVEELDAVDAQLSEQPATVRMEALPLSPRREPETTLASAASQLQSITQASTPGARRRVIDSGSAPPLRPRWAARAATGAAVVAALAGVAWIASFALEAAAPAGASAALSEAPTVAPAAVPGAISKAAPIAMPTAAPIAMPTAAPIAIPNAAPIAIPNAAPTAMPKAAPIAIPTAMETAVPIEAPAASAQPKPSQRRLRRKRARAAGPPAPVAAPAVAPHPTRLDLRNPFEQH
jgi:serine/threonine-protein kinase